MGNLSGILNQAPSQISYSILVADIIFCAVCALILQKFYVKYGQSLSNRKRLASNFLLISVTTTLIITVVKSSLALSLGLVGALSIVRFRSAIKEPEELAYLFLSIAVGLGFGANQHAVTLLSFFLILLLVWMQAKNRLIKNPENLFVSIKLPKNKSLDEVTDRLKPLVEKLDLKRLDYSDKGLEIVFFAEFKDAVKIGQSIKAIKKLSRGVSVSFIDQTGIVV